MEYLIMIDKIIERSEVAICEASMYVWMILEKKQVKLYLGFGVSRLMHNPINRLYLALDQFFCWFVATFYEIKNFIQPLDWV